MEVKKITERLKKFNEDHSLSSDYKKSLNNSNSSSKLVTFREKNLLQLRKNKLEEEIMKNRLNSLAKNKNEHTKYYELEIKLNDFDLINFINEDINSEFYIFDEKEELIKNYISNYIEFEEFKKLSSTKFSIDDMYNTKNFISTLNKSNPEKIFLAYAKFAISKLKEISNIWENINDEGIDFDFELFQMLLKILFSTKDDKIKYEILWILINLTYNSKTYLDNMIETEILGNLFQLTKSQEPGIINHIMWLFSNLLENEELCHIIIKTIPEFLNRINQLLSFYSTTNNFQDNFYVLCWLVYRIFNYTGDSYFEKFLPSIPFFLKVLENEVNKFVLKLDMECDINIETEVEVIKTILLIFDKFTRYIEDTECLRKLINSSLITSITKLLSIEFDKMHPDYLIIIFRVVGGLLSSNNDSDVDYLLNNFGYLEKVEEIIKNLAYKKNPNIENPKKILNNIAWCLSNITGGTKSQIEKVLNTTIPSHLLYFTSIIKDSKYFKEVIFMFYNAFDYGSSESKKILISDDILNLLTEAISNSKDSPEVIKLALDFLRLMLDELKNLFDISIYWNIKRKLEINNLPSMLDRLQYNKNKGISEVAELILYEISSLDDF